MAVKPTFFRRFKAVMLLVGSPAEGERHSAADKAFEMCAAEDMSLQDALEGIFGGGPSTDSAAQMRIDELERDNRMLADEVCRLHERLEKQPGAPSSNEAGYKSTLQKIWSQPQTRLAGAFCVIASMYIMDIFWIPFALKPLKVAILPIFFYLCDLYIFGLFFFDWIGAEDKRNGTGVVFLKGIITIGGLGLSVYAFFGTFEIANWPGAPTNLFAGLLVVGLTAGLALSNAVPALTKNLADSQGQPFKTLRAWFA